MLSVVGTEPNEVAVDGFDNLIRIVQLLNWYSHELICVNGILYDMQLTNAGCLYIAREVWRYSLFDIDIENIAVVGLDLHSSHFAVITGEEPRTPMDNAERIEQYIGVFRYLMNQDAKNIEWSKERVELKVYSSAKGTASRTKRLSV